MDSIWDADKLQLFIAFFVPGFIALQIYGLFVGIDASDITKRLPAVVGYSAIHYAITGWALLKWPTGREGMITAYIVVLILPIFWAPIILLLRDWKKWSRVFIVWKVLPNVVGAFRAALTPEATPWDRLFDGSARYIRIRLKSGAFVGGLLGEDSVTSTYPNDREIFISQAWSFDEDGVFKEEMLETGVLVEGSEIEILESIAVHESEQKNA